jgi:hypothetical protein
MPPQATFVLFERSGGRASRPWRTSACFLLPTGSRPGIGTYARNAMTCRRGSRLGRELARWRTVGETGLRSLPNRDLTKLLTGLEDQAGGMIPQLRWVLPRCWHDSILSEEAESLQETQTDQSAYRMTLPADPKHRDGTTLNSTSSQSRVCKYRGEGVTQNQDTPAPIARPTP